MRARLTLSSCLLLCVSCTDGPPFEPPCDESTEVCTLPLSLEPDAAQNTSSDRDADGMNAVHDAAQGRPHTIPDAGSVAIDAFDAGAITTRDAATEETTDARAVDTMTRHDAAIESGKDAAARDGAMSPVDAASPAPSEPTLPVATGTCPEFKEGSALFAGSAVRLWLADDGESKLGPLLFYWYATNSNVDEVPRALGADVIADIKQRGGMIAAVEKTTKQGTNTGNGVWYTGDFAIADEVLACAIAKGVGIDTKHIHASGFSAGGLQTSWMAYARSNYLASVAPYSGGLSGTRATTAPQDPTNVVPAMLIHGKQGSDTFIIDFAVTSTAMISDIQKKGGFALDCNHGGAHVQPTNLGPAVLRFMLDHGYKSLPSPYLSAIPVVFPSFCKIP